MVTLECKEVKFYSEIDEVIFFEWIKKISCIESFKGKGSFIFLYVKSRDISDEELRELISLFYRYEIEMKQLKVFLTEKNIFWFKIKTKYWHRKIW